VREEYLTFGKPYIGQEEIDEVVDTLESRWLGTGPKVTQLEEKFCEYTGADYAVALNSCTAGLHLSMLVNDIKAGDEVITSPMTFCATANAIIHTGAIPVFVDIDKNTFNIDPEKIEEKITEKTKAILPVHFAGLPCDMDRIMELAQKYNLRVIEDAAHATESIYKGRKIGIIGDMTCFSFYVTKNMVTGEGGMVTTNNKELAGLLKIYALHGMDQDAWKRYSDNGFKHYQVVYPGYKYNMMDLQAAIGIHQLNRLGKLSKRRKEIFNYYNDSFKDLPLILPKQNRTDSIHAYHLYTALVDEKQTIISRDELQSKLHDYNIGTGIHFTSLHLHEYYRKRFNFKPDDFSNARYVSDRTISFPLSGALTDTDVEDVVNSVRMIFS